MIVIPIITDAAPHYRAALAVEGLGHVVAELEDVAGHGFTPEQLEQIDAAETRIARLRARMSWGKGLRELCSPFGRAP